MYNVNLQSINNLITIKLKAKCRLLCMKKIKKAENDIIVMVEEDNKYIADYESSLVHQRKKMFGKNSKIM